MLDVVVGHIGVAQAMHCDVMSQADLFTDLPMPLAGTTADTTAKGEVGRSTDIFMLPADRFVLFLDYPLGRFLFRTCIIQFGLSQFLSHSLVNDLGLLIKLLVEHLQVHHSLLVQNNHTLARFGFRGLGFLLAVHVDHVLIDQSGFAEIIIIRPGQRKSFAYA